MVLELICQLGTHCTIILMVRVAHWSDCFSSLFYLTWEYQHVTTSHMSAVVNHSAALNANPWLIVSTYHATQQPSKNAKNTTMSPWSLDFSRNANSLLSHQNIIEHGCAKSGKCIRHDWRKIWWQNALRTTTLLLERCGPTWCHSFRMLTIMQARDVWPQNNDL